MAEYLRQFFSQQFAFPPKDGIKYKVFSNPNNIPIQVINNNIKHTISGGGGASKGLVCKYKQDDEVHFDIKNEIGFNLYAESSTQFYSQLKGYFKQFRPDINTDYTEDRTGITYTFEIIVLLDEKRKLGYKKTSKEIQATSNTKFLSLSFTNLKYHNNAIIMIYREDSKGNKVLSKGILGDNDFTNYPNYYNSTSIDDNLYGSGSFDVSSYDSVDLEINECKKMDKIGGKVTAYLSSLPNTGKWDVNDEIIINNIVYKYNGTDWIDEKGNGYGILTKGLFSEKPTSLQKIKLGFQYFCVDRKTIEGDKYGIMIYYMNDDIWADALGRIVE